MPVCGVEVLEDEIRDESDELAIGKLAARTFDGIEASSPSCSKLS